jgi:hypothetical protein
VSTLSGLENLRFDHKVGCDPCLIRNGVVCVYSRCIFVALEFGGGNQFVPDARHEFPLFKIGSNEKCLPVGSSSTGLTVDLGFKPGISRRFILDLVLGSLGYLRWSGLAGNVRTCINREILRCLLW